MDWTKLKQYLFPEQSPVFHRNGKDYPLRYGTVSPNLPFIPGAGLAQEAISGSESLAPKIAALEQVKSPELDMSEAARLQRAKDMGFDTSKVMYHGTKGDIENFDPNVLGATTNAPSAKKGFFFASNPETAGEYADLSRGQGELRAEADLKSTGKAFDDFMDQMKEKYPPQDLTTKLVQRMSPKDRSIYEDLLEKHTRAFKNSTSQIPDAGWSHEEAIKYFNNQLRDKQNTLDGLNNHKFYLQQQLENFSPRRDIYGNDITEDSKKELINQLNNHKERTNEVINEINDIQTKLAKSQDAVSNQNILPVYLKYQNPLVHDFQGLPYRDERYSSLMKQAKANGNDAVVFKNTFDPGNGVIEPGAKPQDIVAVFDPSQIRSVNAKFDPSQSGSGNILAGTAATATSMPLLQKYLKPDDSEDNNN